MVCNGGSLQNRRNFYCASRSPAKRPTPETAQDKRLAPRVVPVVIVRGFFYFIFFLFQLPLRLSGFEECRLQKKTARRHSAISSRTLALQFLFIDFVVIAGVFVKILAVNSNLVAVANEALKNKDLST